MMVFKLSSDMKHFLSKCFLLIWFACGFFVTGSAFALAPIPELSSPVVDTTDTLTQAQILSLSEQALALQKEKGSQLQVLIIPTTQPEDIVQYSQRVFDQWKLGREKVDDGVLLLVAMNDHSMRIHVGYGLEGAIPDVSARRIIDEYMVPKFRAGNFAGGISDAVSYLKKLVEGEELPPPPPRDTTSDKITVLVIFGVFIALILMIIALIKSIFSGSSSASSGSSQRSRSSDSSRDSFYDSRERSSSSWSSSSSSSSSSWSGGGGRSGGGGASGKW